MKHVVVQHIKGLSFAGKADSNHWVVMDGPVDQGGSDAAVRPKELLLVALGGCTGIDVASILKKKRVALDNFEMIITADEATGYPQVFTSIHLEYVFYGKDIRAADVERAIELSKTKYCSVSAMLEKAVPIAHTYRIEAR